MKTYEIKNITKEDIKSNTYFRIPKYQRNLVWSDKKKFELINSIQQGFPIGTLLIHKVDERYDIIDGLQRITALKHYYSNPGLYLKSNEKLSTLFSEKRISKENQDEIIKIISNENNLSSSKLGHKIIEYLKSNSIEGISDDIDTVLEETQKVMDNIKIIAIEYQGDSENLPTIFERLNANGTQLSKFDIYAAAWVNYTIEFENKEIKKAIKNRYETMYQDVDISVDFDETSFEYNVFDFGYGLGKVLHDKFPNLFGTKKDFTVPSNGFNLLSLYLFKNVSSISALGKELSSKKDEELKLIYKNIIEKVSIVDKALKRTSINHLTNKVLKPHAEYQLYSFIGYVMKRGVKLDKNEFNKYAWKHLYLDLIKNYWSGSGDSKVETIMKSEELTYESDLDLHSMKEAIKDYIKSENSSNNKGNISSLNRLTISLLYKKSNEYNVDKTMDIEHIVPQNTFKKDTEYPIGSIVNMTFMRPFDNRSKKDKTLWQDWDDLKEKSNFIKIDQEEIIKNYYYPTKDTLNFVDSKQVTKENYKNFLETRTKLIQTKIEEFLK